MHQQVTEKIKERNSIFILKSNNNITNHKLLKYQSIHMGKLTMKNILSSKIEANTKKMIYIVRQIIPTDRVNLNLPTKRDK